MRRINAEIQGGKVQEYWRISSLSDAEVQYLDKQKIQDLVGGSIIAGGKKHDYSVSAFIYFICTGHNRHKNNGKASDRGIAAL